MRLVPSIDPTRAGLPPLSRRDLLRAGAVGAGLVLAKPWAASATSLGKLPLNEFIRDRMSAGKLPGVAATVLRHGRPVWTHAEGWANVERREPIKRDTIFMLA